MKITIVKVVKEIEKVKELEKLWNKLHKAKTYPDLYTNIDVYKKNINTNFDILCPF